MMTTRAAILAAPRTEQAAWLQATDPDYGMRAYEPEFALGLFYPHGANWLDDLRETHGDDLEEYLEGIEPQLSEACITGILRGGVIEAHEAQAILDYIAEEDPDGWVSLIGWPAHCPDGNVFVLCLGKSEGQGGIELELLRVFPAKPDAERAFLELQIAGERMHIQPPVSLRAFWADGSADSTIDVSASRWERIRAGEPYSKAGWSAYEGESQRVFWSFRDGRACISDSEGVEHVIDLPITALLVTSGTS